MPVRTYNDALKFISRFTNYERGNVGYSDRTYNLKKISALLDSMGNPQNAFHSIHITGTKGKGSTAIMCEAILRAHGFRTGLYTSPHLVDMLERIQIDGRNISRRLFTKIFAAYEKVFSRIVPTYFEIMTAIAFKAFEIERVEAAVVEVGMGGRLDTTNIIRPIVCAINIIDYDHTDKLGTRLEQIAFEKAGIIKPGVPVISVKQRPTAMKVIERQAKKMQSDLVVTAGTNAELAIGASHEFLSSMGIPMSFDKTLRTLSRVSIPGRFQILRRSPTIILDTAHNPLSIRHTVRNVMALKPNRVIVLFGTNADKDVAGMVSELAKCKPILIATRSSNPRAASPEYIMRLCDQHSVPAIAMNDTLSATAFFKKILNSSDCGLITGSFYLAGEVLKHF